MKSEWPLPGAERGLRSVAPEPASDPSQLVKRRQRLAESLRHDAGSAAHTMQGFLELFGRGALGRLTPVQEQSLGHLFQAAERMRELIDTAIDLGRFESEREEPRLVRLSILARTVVDALGCEDGQITFAQPGRGQAEEPCLVQREALETTLRTLLDVGREQGDVRLEISLSQTDLHTTLTILVVARASTPPDAESVTQSLPAHAAFSSQLDALAPQLRNRDYLRLKRCEALLERQRGQLLVASDLSRLRVRLPVPRQSP